MNQLTTKPHILPTNKDESNELLAYALELKKSNSNFKINIDQSIYDGVYYRTAELPKDSVIVSANIIIPTTLIISGHGKININGKIIEFDGYHVLHCSPNRRQIIRAYDKVYLTMCFKTDAKTVEEAEKEFTDEVELLI